MIKQIVGLALILCCAQVVVQEVFLDSKAIPGQFRKSKEMNVSALGKRYSIADYRTASSNTVVQTGKIQKVIDPTAQNGDGAIVIPEGTFLSGPLFSKNNTHLYLEKDTVLEGGDDISHFPVKTTRMEEQALRYFMALVSAGGLDGFTVSGEGILNGDGLQYWGSFWLRRSVDPDYTNMKGMRPRITCLSSCKSIQIEGIRIMSSPLWSAHFCRCSFLKLLNLRTTPPASSVKTPGTDAVSPDVCGNVLMKNCYMSVDDDVVALKGGEGLRADKDTNNGENHDIVIEDCIYGFCHSAFTCDGESVLSRNVIVRRCKVNRTRTLLTLEVRPDTPQRYEYIPVEGIMGNMQNCLNTVPWTQFYDLKDRKDTPLSYSNNITVHSIDINYNVFLGIKKSDQCKLSNFCFKNLTVRAEKGEVDQNIIDLLTIGNVRINR